ncbi:HNH endonuclease [Paenibacillus sp. JNUCC32]|uniref:HNH endonuclease n=1 Tax=Paenibacillus sp. JNUCC32 TaxID=2777984 RepID=UPI0017882EAF|nr:HNH endonuclease signature motif containing protein [Paenibacillus sp. JNUCC-32]QOT08457.1 HNH endonuclease [Paenibacillus sp. JNUCC-32]
MEATHEGILKKFDALKGKLIIGKAGIKGINSKKRLPADEYVPEAHIIHNLVRGFYKPADKPYILSYQATESSENYGKQIVWSDETQSEFLRIEMAPPDKENDHSKKSDIVAARYNLEKKIPLGILHKIKKGHNRILGLGIITSERDDGVFIVEPFSYKGILHPLDELKRLIKDEEINTSFVAEVVQRRGQAIFKKKLFEDSAECAICRMDEPTLLIASHIKPWKYSSNFERLDKYNGLLLCPNHDKLFDQGLITFTDDGNVVISSLLTTKTKETFGLTESLFIYLDEGHKKYLSWHRENCFKN